MRNPGIGFSWSYTPLNRQNRSRGGKPLERKQTEPATTSETILFRTLPPNLYTPGPQAPGLSGFGMTPGRADCCLYSSGLATLLVAR